MEIKIGSKAKEFKAKLDKQVQEEAGRSIVTVDPNIFGAFIVSLVVGVASAAIWYLIAVITKYEVGYIAIGLGYLIGWGAFIGSGKRINTTVKIISAGMAFTSILIARVFIFLHSSLAAINNYGYNIANEFEMLDFILNDNEQVKKFFFENFMEAIADPIGLFIWGIAVYFALVVPANLSKKESKVKI